MASIFQASAEELLTCPGIGPTKARRLHDTFHQPFRRSFSTTAAGTPEASQQNGVSLQQSQQQVQCGAFAAEASIAGEDALEISDEEFL